MDQPVDALPRPPAEVDGGGDHEQLEVPRCLLWRCDDATAGRARAVGLHGGRRPVLAAVVTPRHQPVTRRVRGPATETRLASGWPTISAASADACRYRSR